MSLCLAPLATDEPVTHSDAAAPGAIVVREHESRETRGRNDSSKTAERIPGAAVARAVRVGGALASDSRAPTVLPFRPDSGDGSIPKARNTGIGPGRAGVRVTAAIGDDARRGRADLDFYRVDAMTGTTLVGAVTAGTGHLDPALLLYDAAGRQVGRADDEINDANPKMVYRITRTGTYFALVTGSGAYPADPFDATRPPAGGSTGAYQLTLSVSVADVDYYAVSVRAGDVLGVAASGSLDQVELRDAGGGALRASTASSSSLYPRSNPLPVGRVSADQIVERTGRYFVAVTGQAGPYTVMITVRRPPLEGSGRTQTIQLDFAGARIDTAVFARSGIKTPEPLGPHTFRPLVRFLSAWGLPSSAEKVLAEQITATVRSRLESTLATQRCRPRCAVRVRSDLADPAPPGARDVSHIVVGGTAIETGLPTIGIGESVDPGNYATAETGVVLLDFLSAPATQPGSINRHLRAGSNRVKYVADVVADYVLHEVGHVLGAWHTRPTNGRQSLMDSTDIALVVAGVDGVGGTADDVRIDFAPKNQFLDTEGLTGTQNARARIAAALGH